MLYIEDFSYERLKGSCICCGAAIASVIATREHLPSNSFLSKALRRKGAEFDRGLDEPDGSLPQVVVCEGYNAGFSGDETYSVMRAACRVGRFTIPGP